MSVLYIMCGPAGCGKSTWAKKYLSDKMIISRDEIRFELLDEYNIKNNYFAVEKEVYREFTKKICWCLNAGFDTVADATHLTEQSRKKLLTAVKRGLLPINQNKVQYNVVCFHTDYKTCATQNAQREEKFIVPENHLKDMVNRYSIPTLREGFNKIYHIEQGKDILIEY